MSKAFNNRDGWIWLNGSFVPWKNATSHVITQGLHYASAVFEGSDAVMLSGETAVGAYPVESVKMMSEIADSVERDMDWNNFNRYIRQDTKRILDKRSSICHAVMTLSNDLSIRNIIIMTESGQTAIKMAQYRPTAQIYALCAHNVVAQMLSLIWGITPVLVDTFQSTDE